MTDLVGVPGSQLETVWAEALPMIQAACAYNKHRLAPEDYYDEIASGEKQLWYRAGCGIVVTQIIEYPGRKCCSIDICTGDRAAEWWPETLTKLESWAKENGCSQMLLAARTGWARLLKDYERTHIILEKELI